MRQTSPRYSLVTAFAVLTVVLSGCGGDPSAGPTPTVQPVIPVDSISSLDPVAVSSSPNPDWIAVTE
ncbi:hypothetical protein BH11ACT3_BH11ACT3_25710 [soil metagenome]